VVKKPKKSLLLTNPTLLIMAMGGGGNNGGSGTFRYTVWDPWRILAQIATLQAAYYVSLGLWVFFVDALGGYSRSLEHIFKYQVKKESIKYVQFHMNHISTMLKFCYFFCAAASGQPNPREVAHLRLCVQRIDLVSQFYNKHEFICHMP